ncbi:hypothetical protein Vadar_022989 [Vaccinium darrowii]|uniref:Uncharacterized protein n=1 Tax=Vaccinium darrowii TaxID=229202 RepID=A0ACB7ZDG6_9ERIC|nr:hypothetical protein Vadar_022989 [Vaccinium darrowii]
MSDPANNFPILPPGRYFLCDAAYSHTRGFMTPYRNVRYWLSDFRNGRRPRNKEERFNLAHARLRNVIERAFGVLKARFPILKRMSSYPFAAQRNIVIACITMHNYSRRTCISDIFLDEFNDPNAFYGNAQQHVDNLEAGGGSTQADQIFMLNLHWSLRFQLVGGPSLVVGVGGIPMAVVGGAGGDKLVVVADGNGGTTPFCG